MGEKEREREKPGKLIKLWATEIHFAYKRCDHKP